MGGSAWPAEILDSWLNNFQKDYIIEVCRSYSLPPRIPPKTLCIFSSYSGNTEEPLAVYQEAKKANLPMAAICSGGQLKENCLTDNVPFVEIPQGLVPRMATGYLFTALVKIIAAAVPNSIDEALLSLISDLSKDLKPQELESQGKELAEKIKGRIPLIYSSDRLKVLGYIWKIKLNETAKTPAFNNFFPELNHNEFSMYTDEDLEGLRPIVLILKDADDHRRVLKRMKLSTDIIKSKKIPVEVIDIKAPNLISRMFSSIILSDWTVYYLAQIYEVDPLTTNLQEDFKKDLRR
jgi:glucose/mannose-6-phosphate isomerase